MPEKPETKPVDPLEGMTPAEREEVDKKFEEAMTPEQREDLERLKRGESIESFLIGLEELDKK